MIPKPAPWLLCCAFLGMFSGPVVFGGQPPAAMPTSGDLQMLTNGSVRVGIDLRKGGSITWLSWAGHPRNAVNHADPGRLIQQSYYAGAALDRTVEGQSKAWSPWTWNPIQGGGVGSWARIAEFKREADTLYAETIPKLWDMPDEEAAARMKQWTGFEPGQPDVVVVRCEFLCQRAAEDRWGAPGRHHQEIPACYFTRHFSTVKSYLGDRQWRDEIQPPGPPWGHAQPPRKAMACFTPEGEGIAIFSPTATEPWNFGPHGSNLTDDPSAGPCMHVAPLDRVSLGARTTYRYRYWLVVGDANQLADRLESLWLKYSKERAELGETTATTAPASKTAQPTAPK